MSPPPPPFQKKSNTKFWCEYCKIYVYDNKICRTKHDNSPQHKAAQTRYIERLQKEEREKEKLQKDFELRTGVNLENKSSVSRKESFYSKSNPKLQPVNMLTMNRKLDINSTAKGTKTVGVLPSKIAGITPSNTLSVIPSNVVGTLPSNLVPSKQPLVDETGASDPQVEEDSDLGTTSEAETFEITRSEGQNTKPLSEDDVPIIMPKFKKPNTLRK